MPKPSKGVSYGSSACGVIPVEDSGVARRTVLLGKFSPGRYCRNLHPICNNVLLLPLHPDVEVHTQRHMLIEEAEQHFAFLLESHKASRDCKLAWLSTTGGTYIAD